MALLPILEFPDSRLRTKAVPVDVAHIGETDFQRLIDDMTMRRFSKETQRNYLRDVGRCGSACKKDPVSGVIGV